MQIKRNDISTILQYLHLLSVMALVCTLPFYYSPFQQYALILSFATFILEFCVSQRWHDWHWDYTKLTFLAMAAFYLLMPLMHIFENTDTYFAKQMETRLAFVAIPLLGICGANPRYKLNYIGFTFIISATILAAYVVIRTLVATGMHADLTTCQITALYIRLAINNHMIFNQHLCIALAFTCYFAIKYHNLPLRIALASTFAISQAYMLLAEGRAGFIGFNLIVIIFIAYLLIRWNKIGGIIISALIIAAAILMVGSHRQLYKDSSPESIAKDPRIAIWTVSLNLIRQRPVFGYGVSDGEELFIDESIRQYPELLNQPPQNPDMAWRGRNIIGAHTHSTFVQTMLEFGIVGLVIFLSIIVLAVISSKGEERLLMILFLTGWLIQASVEVLGCGLYPITFCLMIYTIICSKPPTPRQTDMKRFQRSGNNPVRELFSE